MQGNCGAGETEGKVFHKMPVRLESEAEEREKTSRRKRHTEPGSRGLAL